MNHVFMYPKNPRIKNVLERLSKMESNCGRAMRIEPDIALQLSHDKSMRILNEKNFIDIASRRSGPHRSILYFDKHVKIIEKNGKYYFYF